MPVYSVLQPTCCRYYMVELTFYWSLFFSQFVDVQRKVGHTNLI